MTRFDETVLPLFREAGAFILPHFGSATTVAQKSASPADVVTELDIRTESFFKERLLALHPDISFVGEENGGDRSAERLWLMDPIDGTGHFIRGLPFCTTMLALIENGAVTFSVIYDFVRDELYVADKGKGATCNGKPIYVSTRALKDAYISFEGRYDKSENMDRFHALREKSLVFISLNAGYEHAMVACGKLDARIAVDPWGKDYDFAPGSFLVSEAGGVVRNIGLDTYDYRNLNFIATNPVIYKELTEGPQAVFPLT